MNRKARFSAVFLAAALCMAASLPALADDSAAAIAAGGLVPRRETRIVMAKEVLRIGLKKIVVDYDFRNDSDQDVTTEVAFPVPPYENSWQQLNLSDQVFADFHLQVDGRPVSFLSESKAILNGKDVTAILIADKIDIASFGHMEEFPNGNTRFHDLARLPESEQERLVKLGLYNDLEKNQPNAKWTVHLQYHWTQTFPAHSTVQIRHEYSPRTGDAYEMGEDVAKDILEAGKMPVNEIKPKPLDPDGGGDLTSFCLGLPLAKNMAASLHQQSANVTNNEKSDSTLWMDWVDFILTSANTWRRPIEDFTLIVERPKPEYGGKTLISFCSPANGKVEKLDADHFQVHLTNFIPASELHIGFFEIGSTPVPDYTPAMKSAPPTLRWKTTTTLHWKITWIAVLYWGVILFLIVLLVIRRRKIKHIEKSQQ